MLRRTTKQAAIAVGLAAAAVIATGTPAADAAARPAVLSAVEGRDAAQGHNVLIVYGTRLTLVKTWSLVRSDDTPVDGATVSIKSNTVVVLALPDGITAGSYKVRLATKKPPAIDVPVVLSLLAAPLETIEVAQLSGAAQADLADAETVHGEAPASFHDASRLVSTNDGVVFTGTPGLGAIPATGAGTRLMWYPAKGAFRAGTVNAAQWDAANVGANSVATGFGTIASGEISMAMGEFTVASGKASTAMGHGAAAGGVNATAMGEFTVARGRNSTATGAGTEAQGDNSTATGIDSLASGANSTAMGEETSATGGESTATGSNTTASGVISTAMGDSTTASGDVSTAMGGLTTASGVGSTAMGEFTTASGVASTATGESTTASGDDSAAMGKSTTAKSFASLALGRFNVEAGDSTQWIDTDPLFVAGNGTSAIVRSNALTLLKNGKLGIGTASPTAGLHVVSVDGALFVGTNGSGAIPATGAGTRMMWYPAKAAFRAGQTSGVQWDVATVGTGSVAMGSSTTASGIFSTATGDRTIASGGRAAAFGLQTTASGVNSTATGFATKASGNASTAMGDTTTASGDFSTALGAATIASGNTSTAMGGATTAQAYHSLALGRFNVVAGNADQWIATDPVLVVGNGTTTSARANAFTLLKNGNLTIAGTLTQNSDARLKADVKPLAGVLAKLRGVRGVSYRFKDGDGPAGPQIGLLAQEVEKAFPELVATDADGKLSVAYGNFAAVLLEATKEEDAVIREQTKQIDAQKSEIELLRAALAAVDERLQRIESSR